MNRKKKNTLTLMDDFDGDEDVAFTLPPRILRKAMFAINLDSPLSVAVTGVDFSYPAPTLFSPGSVVVFVDGERAKRASTEKKSAKRLTHSYPTPNPLLTHS